MRTVLKSGRIVYILRSSESPIKFASVRLASLKFFDVLTNVKEFTYLSEALEWTNDLLSKDKRSCLCLLKPRKLNKIGVPTLYELTTYTRKPSTY